jgi:hypothetical protein
MQAAAGKPAGLAVTAIPVIALVSRRVDIAQITCFAQQPRSPMHVNRR